MYKILVIIGGAFAGTKAAQELEHNLPPEWTLTLISQENFITFNPLLPEVVGASILPGQPKSRSDPQSWNARHSGGRQDRMMAAQTKTAEELAHVIQ
jgi:hypothetical protein